MAILSYLVIPVAGAARQVAGRLEAIPGCEVVRAENRELLILVTDTADAAAEEELRASLERVDGISSLSIAFGEVAG